jgi:hypothetical protein
VAGAMKAATMNARGALLRIVASSLSRSLRIVVVVVVTVMMAVTILIVLAGLLSYAVFIV